MEMHVQAHVHTKQPEPSLWTGLCLFHISDSIGCQVGGSVRGGKEQWLMTKAGLDSVSPH